MLSNHRLLLSGSLPMVLLAIAVVSACEGPKTDKPDIDVSRAPISTDKRPRLPPGSANYQPFTTITEGRLGVRIYPGARPRDGGSWELTDQLQEGAQSLMMATLYSDDGVDEVADFYARELGIPPAQVLRLPTPGGSKASITKEHNGRGAINVMLQPADNKSGTIIEITRMTGEKVPENKD